MSTVDMKPADGVCLVPDPFQCHQPFSDRVAVEGPDTVAKESVRAGVDHVVLDGWEVDHALVLVAGDCQISDEHYLVSVQRSAVNLIGLRQDCLL